LEAELFIEDTSPTASISSCYREAISFSLSRSSVLQQSENLLVQVYFTLVTETNSGADIISKKRRRIQ